MSEIRSLGTAGRIKRALVASGLALATVSWLGVSAMPASAVANCSYSGGDVVFESDDSGSTYIGMWVSDSDGRLRVDYGSTIYVCTASFVQTRSVETITLGSSTDYADDTYIDLASLTDMTVEINTWTYYDYDLYVYNTNDDPQGGLDINVRGGRTIWDIQYGDVQINAYVWDDSSAYDGYFDEFFLAGTGADDTITVSADSYDEEIYVWGDRVDFWNDADVDDDECTSDRSGANDVIDLSEADGDQGYTYIFGCGGDDTITGTGDGDYIYGGDGFDWVEDGRGDDDVEAEWFYAGASQQGDDDYYTEDGLNIFDYSARTRPLFLSNNDEEASGEIGEEDMLDEDNTGGLTWLLGGSGDDSVIRGDYDDEYIVYLQGGAGTNTLDCNDDTDGDVYTYADYEFSPSAVNVDLATGTATGWGTDRLIGCDDVVGSESADTISGNGNFNEIYGNLGDDTISGLGSGDLLYGDGGDDTINGGDGDDDIVGNDGRDTLNGDAGDDYMGATVDEEGDCNASDDSGLDDGILDAFDLYELPGDGGTEAGNDKFNGGSGDDYMCGGTGEDRVLLSSGVDVFDGGAGRNLVDASALESGVRIDLQLEEASWDGWNTYLQRVKDAVGSNYNDRITAATIGALDGNVGSKISGRGGNDEIIGFSGPDQLRGNADNDKIFAGSGTDKLRGGAGNDELWGQGGVDTGNGGAGSDVCKSVERATGCETTLSRQQLV